MQMQHKVLSLTILLAFSGLSQAADLTTTYSQNFDSMGTTGTTAPTDWRVLVGESSTSNTTWTASTGIPGSGVASLIASSGVLTATSAPTANNNNSYNAARTSTATSDRVLATASTTVSGAALELKLTNTTGSALNSINISYDTVRFTSVSSANELPGYWLFYSLDNTNWTNVSSLNPTISTVPNTVGVTATSGTISFSASIANSQNFYLRWVDDNAAQTSPDQIIGLNNVQISAVTAAVPEPETYAMFAAGLMVLGASVRRRNS